MALNRDDILNEMRNIKLPDGTDLPGSGLIQALAVESGAVRFVLEAKSPEDAANLSAVRDAAEAAVKAISGVTSVSVVLTAHAPAAPPPSLKGAKRPAAPEGRQKIAGVNNIIAIGSGKGGVGKSTVSSNLAVALAKQGRRVGLLDADIYGPSQPRMMGVDARPKTDDDDHIIPLVSHGVKMMSIGLMVDPDQALAWRGPMLMKALQQLLREVAWGELDVLIIDLPPGTGDVQLTLGQKTEVTGTIIVSTPQDVALLDARRAITMFKKLETPILGLIENMSSYVCPECGHEAHIFGHGGVRDEAKKLGVPFLGELPLDLDVRLGGDAGKPVAAGEGPLAEAYTRLAKGLVEGGVA
ncbi:MAG: Mrp/NBP35 family ATP-binding protein [Marinosulfonomonas sp.]|nr:Mrp/NBP35 family ATP-binding protein [Marinosulfonomonas sp.]